MDEEEDLVPDPDSKGSITLSNRAWVNLDPYLWTLSMRIVRLDLSYNHLEEVPPQIGELVVMRELILSFNKIHTIPPEIGKARRLKKVFLNSNRLKRIPVEFGQLDSLEELFLNENVLEEVPVALARLFSLRILKLSNNRLRTLPCELADVVSLENIDCANNPNLDIVPPQWRGDSDSVLFVCRVHRDYTIRMNEMQRANLDLTKHSQVMEVENLSMKERVTELLVRIDELVANMPKKVAIRMEKLRLEKEEREFGAQKEKKENCVVS